MIHVTREGVAIELQDMSDAHLWNTIKWIDRRSLEGVDVVTGAAGCDGCDVDVTTLYGDRAREHLGYSFYLQERNRRMEAKQ